MTMERKLSGAAVEKGHTSLTRSLLRDNTVSVESKGSSFYNANKFPIIEFMYGFCEYMGNNEDKKTLTSHDVDQIWRSVRKEVKGSNKIVIASTPDQVSRDYLRVLDGGILHESFHSMYTHSGDRVKMASVKRTLTEHFDPEVDYSKRGSLLKSLWNIFEDSMIERRGCEEFGGALYSIQRTHELIWNREAPARRAPVGSVFYDDEGNRRKAFDMMGHVTCYLRDRVENYLEDAPFDEYHPNARYVVDALLGDLVDEGQKSQDTYECFELALRTLNRLAKLEGEGGGEGDESDEDGDGEGESQSQSGGDEGDESESGDKSESQGGSADGDDESASDSDDDDGESGENDPQDDSGETDSGSDSDDESSEGDDGEGDSDGSDDAEDEGDELHPDEAGSESEGGLDEGSRDEQEPIDFDKLAEKLRETTDAEGMEDLSDAINDKWQEEMSKFSLPSEDVPLYRDADKVNHVKGRKSHLSAYKDFADKVRRDTLYIRPKMVAYLRGEAKTHRTHRQERGRRLSSRSVHEVVYKKEPRPFQRRTRIEQEKAAVSIVLDESGSMDRATARYMLTTFAVSLQQIRIPFEVIGYQMGNSATTVRNKALRDRNMRYDDKNKEEREWRDKFTRVYGAKFNVFRTFDDPLTDKSLSKLMETRASGGTPLLAGYDFAARRLAQRPEDRRLIIVITDGAASRCSKVNLTSKGIAKVCNNLSERLEGMGIETLFVGYNSTTVRKYRNHVYIPTLKEFSTKMNDYLLQQLRTKRF